MTDQHSSRPEIPTEENSDAIEQARELLHQRQTDLFDQRRLLQDRRMQLITELKSVERDIESLRRRIDGIRDVLTVDFPAGRFDPVSWEKLSVPEAAFELLDEAGGFLTESQIRAGLAAHGMSVDDTEAIAFELVNAATSGAPLLKISEDLWARADWAEEARISRPDLYRKQ